VADVEGAFQLGDTTLVGGTPLDVLTPEVLPPAGV
jgi:hypothetical protein